MRYGCCNEPVIVSERSGEFVADLEDDGAMVFGVVVVALVVDLLLLVGGFLLLVNLALLLLIFGYCLATFGGTQTSSPVFESTAATKPSGIPL